MPIRPFQKFRKQQEAVFGGTCDGVLYDVDISKENTKDIFWFTVFAVRQEGLCYTCFLLFIYQSKYCYSPKINDSGILGFFIF